MIVHFSHSLIFLFLTVSTGTTEEFFDLQPQSKEEDGRLDVQDIEPGYSYDLNDRKGPFRWGKIYPHCAGFRQSPINIDTIYVVRCSYPRPLSFTGINTTMSSMEIANDLHTVVIRPTFSGPRPTITGGPLFDTYIFESMHFHWGLLDYDGSEHAIDGHKYSMEAHMIFFKQSAQTFAQAQTDPNGLVVVAVLAQVKDNGVTLPLTGLEGLVMPYSMMSQEAPSLTLQAFMPRNFVYATYKGSLTTPPCTPNVEWIVSLDPLEISKDMLKPFRVLLDGNRKPMTPNFRPLQGQRQVCTAVNEFV